MKIEVCETGRLTSMASYAAAAAAAAAPGDVDLLLSSSADDDACSAEFSASVCSRHLQLSHITRPCIPPGSQNRVPASAGGKGGNVTSVGWQVTLCDSIWNVSPRRGVAG